MFSPKDLRQASKQHESSLMDRANTRVTEWFVVFIGGREAHRFDDVEKAKGQARAYRDGMGAPDVRIKRITI